MRYFFIILFLPCLMNAQTRFTESVSGHAIIPALQSIHVEQVREKPLEFSAPADLSRSTIIVGYYKVTVLSNVPWVVTVAAANSYLTIMEAGIIKKLPISSFSLRGNATPGYSILSTTPFTVLRSENNKIVNTYYIDLMALPGDLPHKGNYSVNLIFSVAPE